MFAGTKHPMKSGSSEEDLTPATLARPTSDTAGPGGCPPPTSKGSSPAAG